MTPLPIISSDPGGSDRLAAQVVARPDKNPPPAIESWPYLLQPKAIHIRLMPDCDAACDFCQIAEIKAGDKVKEEAFPPEAWERIKQAWLPDLLGVECAGLGEPTLSKMWGTVARDVLSATNANGEPIRFYAPTNGHYLDKPFVYEPLGTGRNVTLSLSLDAGTPETYVKVGRGKNEQQWWDTLAAVKTCMEKCPEIQWHSQFTASRANINDLESWMETLASLKIKNCIMRWVQTHSVAREDYSLRWSRDECESAIEAARAVAERGGISFEAERRPYSDMDPNLSAKPDADSPTNRLRKYLDLMPASTVINCSGKTTTISDGKTCTTILGGTDTTSVAYPQGDGTEADVIYGNNDTVICGSSSCVRRTETTVGIHYNATSTGFPGTVVSISDTCAGFGTFSSDEEGVDVVRSVIIPRTATMDVMSTDAVQPISLVDSSPVVWSDGSISSCFSKHMIGSIYTDTMPTLIRNPDYQAFLQRRDGQDEGANSPKNSWCYNCPRNF